MGFDKQVKLNIVTWFITLSSAFCSVQPPSINPAILNAATTIGECQSCKIFVESFKKGLERTARGKYEGGDAAWEEEKLKKTYKRSEIRLVDIQEGICKEETKYDIQCHHVANKAEEYIEEWWAQDPDESDDLYSYICIEKLRFCCPKNHFGKDCNPCLGDHTNLCSGNGKCRGDGTRKGNGTCLCDVGYTGENCDQCSTGYFLSYKDDNKMLCSECHKGCLGGCRGGSQKDCAACKPGFIFDSKDGCLDINECDDEKRCKEDQFCLNSLGSYTCMNCDKACKGCHGAGPDMCRKCAKGYSMKGEFCILDREGEDNSEIMTTTRYFTYIGLLIATGILLPKSTSLGSIVGFMVMSYIMGAEYYCMINGHTGLVNLTNYDLFQLLRT
ncbi:cysteine-rich with EGF-like domain protein 2 isoform X1 [Maniola jurtina]|uniref:cysteine-rich with EGF-like domain protein 2 isoform X1 n=1 Tax=Maniola jurtina TaxID=191418 RepID=UPI001E688EEC|nr:cysteine-rich with EGF-like domain protein 2 isoform X1 [Maniola jurtina]XP_045761696.1 cysteine-rich with EGF-like domain protein 2 isoform X1 [Maniola jurtina]XP_045761697.1 cysteine-rich with EGF-like domain protein 2 isoform X1 [Maniola jurtina]